MPEPRRSRRSPRVSDDESVSGRVIEIVGPAGIGKSTLLPVVVARLREQLHGVRVITVSPDRRVSDVGRLERMWALATARGWPSTVLRIALASRGARIRALRRWTAILSTMAVSRRQAARGRTVVVVEQATVQLLRRNAHLAQLDASMLPDLVVEVTAHPAVVLRRRLDRRKPPNRGEMLNGERREMQAERLAWRLADLDEQDAVGLISAWSSRFCEPPLTETELLAAVTRGRARPEPEDPQNHWSGRTIRTAIRERVSWVVVENDATTSLDQAADAVISVMRRSVDGGEGSRSA